MRAARILVVGLLLMVVVVGGTAAIALRNRTELVRLVLARIKAGTGLEIVPAGTHVDFRSHLVVLLERPRILVNGAETARIDDVRVVISYHAIFYRNGLPLRALVLDHPVARIPASAAGVTPHGLPEPNVAVATRLLAELDALSGIADRVELIDAALSDVDGSPLVDHLDLTAYREHRRPGRWPWLLSFDAEWKHPPYESLRVAGNVRLGAESFTAANTIGRGQVRFWGLDLSHFPGPYGIQLSGQAHGSIRFALHNNGEVAGNADSGFSRLVLNGNPFASAMALGDYSLHASYAASTRQINLRDVRITRGANALLSGSCAIGNPYEATRTVALSAGGSHLALAQFGPWLRTLRAVPQWLSDLAGNFSTGQFVLERADFAPAQPFKQWSAATLRDHLNFQAELTHADFVLPSGSALPPIRGMEAQLTYSHGRATLSQGSASIGQSSLTRISAEADLRGTPARISYKARAKGEIATGEIYPLVQEILRDRVPELATRIRGINGNALAAIEASGVLQNLQWMAPRAYAATISPERVEIAVSDTRDAIALKGGQITVRPNEIQIVQLLVSEGGNAIINGTITPAKPIPVFRNFTAELHEFRAERWLPLLIEPKQLSVNGAVGGRLIANSGSARGTMPLITGNLTLGSGEVQFGFLRAPLITHSATLVLDGKGLVFASEGATLEGHPVDFKLGLADFDHPLLRFDANAAAMDFEVMYFIRVPWSPRAPINFFPLPVEGHIAAHQANFGKLRLSEVSTDFERNHGIWRVYNFSGDALAGHVDLEISGVSSEDNNIHMIGHVGGIDAAALFMLLGERKPALTGKLSVTTDLWANTDTDFFDTLKGSASVLASNGTLNRFALVSRILSFIDLKNWLTAHLPDPNTSGIPFATLKCTLNGANGNFTTDDLRLSGPVMEVVASGDIRLTDSTMDMEISLIPFDTVNWLVQHIPLIGSNLAAGSKGLVAAYFHVYGPVSNPTVLPKPITSVAEFVAKTLSMPINILVPNTIKP